MSNRDLRRGRLVHARLMTQNSRRHSGNRPFDGGSRKSEEDARESSRAAVQDAHGMTPRQRATLERQGDRVFGCGDCGRQQEDADRMATRFAAEREADALAATADRLVPEAASS